jgi:5-formyltetrahydrofolate cyclo-ligase
MQPGTHCAPVRFATFREMNKSELRKIYLQKQKSLSEKERREKSLKIADNFFAKFSLETVNFLHIFLPIEKNNEIDTNLIISTLWRDFPEIFTILSRVDFETMTLENLRFHSATKLIKNKWHIDEPTGAELVEIEKIDVVLVPLLAFDKKGFRVGYGKGFYDRFLNECRKDVLKIGVSYFAPVVEISDVNEFDVKLDFCITPEKVWHLLRSEPSAVADG